VISLKFFQEKLDKLFRVPSRRRVDDTAIAIFGEEGGVKKGPLPDSDMDPLATKGPNYSQCLSPVPIRDQDAFHIAECRLGSAKFKLLTLYSEFPVPK
jgi:hypothetical protein